MPQERAWLMMRLLLDESVPVKFRRSLPNHGVRTVVEMGWSGAKNGQLLALATTEFDAFATVDKNLPYQHKLTARPIAVIVLDAFSNEVSALLPLVPELERVLASMKPRTYTLVNGVA